MIRRLLHPYIQIERGYVEQVGSALNLYRFKRFDLTVCFELRMFRVAVTIH